MKSNSLYTILLRHIFLILAFLCFTIGIQGYFGAGAMVNGELTSFDVYDLTIALGIGIIMIIFWLLMKDKVMPVRLGGQNITIFNGEETKVINWFDVEKINQLIFIEPPLYKLRIKGQKRSYTNLIIKCRINKLNYFLSGLDKKYQHSCSYDFIF